MHTALPNKYLKFIPFTETVFWDYYTLSHKNVVNSNHPIVSLKEVLTQRKGFITIEDSKTYKRCRVQIQGKGVVIRDEVPGKDIKTKKQQLCKTDDFLVAEIDAKVGGYGIVPPELENAIVSGHYFLFEIDKSKLLPEFLGLVVKQSQFAKQVKSTGSTNYAAIRPSHVMEYKIPLPNILEQEKLINTYNEKMQEAQSLIDQAINVNVQIEKYLLKELAVTVDLSTSKTSLMHLVEFKDASRWDTLFLAGRVPTLQSKFKLVSFSDVVKHFNRDSNYKSIRIDSFKQPDKDFRYIGMEHVEKETGKLLDLPVVKGKHIKSQTIRVPKNFFIYGKLRPYLNKYWVNETDFENIICSSEFFVFGVDEQVNQHYFKSVLSSKIVQNQIADKTSGARMPRINEDVFFNLQFPLPNIEVQNLIAENIEVMKAKIEADRSEAIKLKSMGAEQFEKEIFN